jgi:hypothetical protein
LSSEQQTLTLTDHAASKSICTRRFLFLPQNFPILSLNKNFGTHFSKFFLPWIRTLERISRNFAEFELEKLQIMCSEIFVQEQNRNFGVKKRVREKREKNLCTKLLSFFTHTKT